VEIKPKSNAVQRESDLVVGYCNHEKLFSGSSFNQNVKFHKRIYNAGGDIVG